MRKIVQTVYRAPRKNTNTQQTKNICITFIQRRPNVLYVGPTLFKFSPNVLCLLGIPDSSSTTAACSSTFHPKGCCSRFQALSRRSIQTIQISQRWASGRHIATCGDRSKISDHSDHLKIANWGDRTHFTCPPLLVNIRLLLLLCHRC